VILGDSFLATTHQITAYLETLARKAGSLDPGYRYRDYSRLAVNALAWMGEGILDQYQGATLDGAARVVIMNGGGADVLLGSCEPVGADCPLLTDAAASFTSLLELLAADEVEQVVFLGYPNPIPPPIKDTMDLLRPLLIEACSESSVPCYWIELRDVFEGKYESYIGPDGLTPTPLGAQATAEAIWKTMQEECIAQ
jgi:hypothetical protein